MTAPRIIITAWNLRPNASPNTIGYADVVLPDRGIKIHGVCVRRTAAGPLASLPQVPATHSGKKPRGRKGSAHFTDTVTFVEQQDYLAFSKAVVSALQRMNPKLFA